MGGRLRGDRIRAPPEIARARVALQANREHHRTLQQLGVGRAMRIMASLASIHANGRVLVHEWPPLVHMTFQARLLVCLDLLGHCWTSSHAPSGSEASVRIVAIRALNRALIY